MCVTIHFGPMGAHFTFSLNRYKIHCGQNFASPTGTVGRNDQKMQNAQTPSSLCPTKITKRIIQLV